MEMVESEILNRLKINKDRCKGCEYCVLFCPKNVLKMSDDLNTRGVHYIVISNPENCTSCGICAMMCPDVCIEVYK